MHVFWVHATGSPAVRVARSKTNTATTTRGIKVSLALGSLPSYVLRKAIFSLLLITLSRRLQSSAAVPTLYLRSTSPVPIPWNAMPKVKSGFYAVQKGKLPGVYSTWEECEAQVKGFPGASYKKFRTLEEAQAFAGAAPSGDRGTDHQSQAHSTQKSGITGVQSSTAAFSNVGRSIVPLGAQQHGPGGEKEGGKGESTGEKAPRDYGDERDTTIVYTDGACSSNGRFGAVAGIGVWWGSGDERNLSERCPGSQTNNRAEIYAIIRFLEEAPTRGSKGRLVIRTDSKYTINCVMNWARNWEAKGWKTASGEKVKNAGMIQYLLALLSLRRSQGDIILFEHVRGHSGNVGNDAADYLARNGTTRPIIPERDWLAETQNAEKSMKTTMTSSIESNTIGFAISEDDILSAEELEALEQSQNF